MIKILTAFLIVGIVSTVSLIGLGFYKVYNGETLTKSHTGMNPAIVRLVTRP